MWIYFNEPVVFDYLSKNGFVYTVRGYPAKYPLVRFVKRGRNPSYFPVKMETVLKVKSIGEEPNYEVLRAYVGESGFADWLSWVKTLKYYYVGEKELWLLKAIRVEPIKRLAQQTLGETK